MSKSYLNNALAIKANEQYNEYKELFAEEIKFSVNNSDVYRDPSQSATGQILPITADIKFDALKTNDSIFANASGKTAVLNFASYTRPGGGFLKGAHAQEESMCMGSTLYNVLEQFKDEYDSNYSKPHSALYENFAIYSPDIVFVGEDKDAKVDVITCPAPNVGAYLEKNPNFSGTEQYNCMLDRILFLLDICEDHQVDTVILGAFGCGVFGNAPGIVAHAFRDALGMGQYNFKSVIFSIPDENKLKLFKFIIEHD